MHKGDLLVKENTEASTRDCEREKRDGKKKRVRLRGNKTDK